MNSHIAIIKQAAKESGYKFNKFDKFGALYELDAGKKKVLCDRMASEKTSHISYLLASNKRRTFKVLKAMKLPAPEQIIASTLAEVKSFFEKKKPIVVKPYDGSLGLGVTVNIRTLKELKAAIVDSQKYGKKFIAEEYVLGDDFRVLVVDNKDVYAVQRVPAFVDGDGKHSIEQLVEIKNKVKKEYKKDIKVDAKAITLLKEQGYTPKTVLAVGERGFLRNVANVAEGGTTIDKTDEISDYIKNIAIQASKVLKLPVAGLDVIAPDITGKKMKIIEVNSNPHVILNEYPHVGRKYKVTKKIIKTFLK